MMRNRRSSAYEVRVKAQHAIGERSLQNVLTKLLAKGYSAHSILSTGYRGYTVVGMKTFKVRK